MATAVLPPVSAQVVGIAFVQQYYQILHNSPALLHRFYQDISKLGRPQDDGTMTTTTTMTEINEKVMSLNYDEFRSEIKSVDAQESYHMGVSVLVTGYLVGKDNLKREFTQSFFLAPQERGGYFVLNDMFRYVDKIDIDDEKAVSVKDDGPYVSPEQGSGGTVPIQEDSVSEETVVLPAETIVHPDETIGEEVHTHYENGEVEVAEEDMAVAVVVYEIPDDSQLIVESNIIIEEVPKKSYASIVRDLKGSPLPFKTPTLALHKTPRKSQEQLVNHAPPSALGEVSVSNLETAKNVNNQVVEADGYSIYIKGLPFNATPALIKNEFKRFGTIKSGGIQVRTKQGFSFGFVEFEEASAVQKAIEASPIALGGRLAVIEQKKSTNTRGNNRGKFAAGRGPGFRSEGGFRNDGFRSEGGFRNDGFRSEGGFRNDGLRGRWNYVGSSRGYGQGEFSGRTDFNSRGNYRGGSSNRSGDGYHRAESGGTNGSRVNRVGGVNGGGTFKNLAPRVPASATMD